MPFKTIARFGKPKPKKVEVPAMRKKVSLYELVLENIKTRRSVRKFLKADVDETTIDKILEAGRWAPSAGNHQPWEFIVVRDKNVKDWIVDAAYGEEWMRNAPVLIVACINMRLARSLYGERGEKLYGIQDVANAIENVLLAANALGLGTCWVGSFSEPELAHKLHCPDYARPAAIIAVGWPAESPKIPSRHGLSEFVHENTFGRTRRALKVWGHGHGEV